jgi:hypothetical protein
VPRPSGGRSSPETSWMKASGAAQRAHVVSPSQLLKPQLAHAMSFEGSGFAGPRGVCEAPARGRLAGCVVGAAPTR